MTFYDEHHCRFRSACPVAADPSLYPPIGWLRQWGTPLFLLAPVFLLAVRLTIFLRRRSAEDFATVDATAVVQVVATTLMIVMILSQCHNAWLYRQLSRSSYGWLLAFQGFCAISALWSPLPLYTLYRAVEVTAVFVIVYLALAHIGMFERGELLVLLFILALLLLDYVGHVKRWGRFMAHANSYPATGAMLLCYCLGEVGRAEGRRKGMLAICGVISFASIIAGTSATWILASICGAFCVCALSGGSRGRQIFIVTVVLIGVLSALFAEQLSDPALRLLFPGKDWDTVCTGHGRVALWRFCLERFREQPFWGRGFAVATRVEGVNTAHNMVLAVLLDTGLIGLGLFLMWFRAMALECRVSARCETRGYRGCWGAFAAGFTGSMGAPVVGTDIFPAQIAFACLLAFSVLFVAYESQRADLATRALMSLSSHWR